MARIGLGILSFAHGHASIYAQVWARDEDVELVACWDDDEQRGKAAAERYGMRYSPHLEDVLENPQVDAVCITSETSRHAELCEAAAASGKAILLQKPMALTLADCDRIIQAVERHGVFLSMAFQMRHDPSNLKMKELLEAGAIGRVGLLRRRHCISVLFSPQFVQGPTRWHLEREKNRGMFMDDAVHAADFLLWFLGMPVSVMAEIDNTLTQVAPDDTGVALYRFPDGAFGVLVNSSVTWAGENTTEIYGDKGVIIQNHDDGPSTHVLPPHPIALKLYQAEHPEKGWQDFGLPIPKSHGERIAGVARPFVECLLQGKPPIVSAREGRQSVEMVLGAYLSARTGRRIHFPLTEDVPL